MSLFALPVEMLNSVKSLLRVRHHNSPNACALARTRIALDGGGENVPNHCEHVLQVRSVEGAR
jgi:hypothetical protein